ncbi:MAG: glycosyltransferase family 9 protein, partial [Thiohalomonadales bacterium]
NYTKQLAESYWAIDKVIIEPQHSATTLEKIRFLRYLKAEKFDISISLFSSFSTGLQLLVAGIPYRYAPATKIAQLLYNRKLKQRRSLSKKPEFEYNLDMVRFVLSDTHTAIPEYPVAPILKFESQTTNILRTNFYTRLNLNINQPLIFLHPGSGGSANNLSLQQFSELAGRLSSRYNAVIIITAGPNEANYASDLAKLLHKTPNRIFESHNGLVDFSMHITFANLFIGGSTGPLHIAGALNIPTVGFYPKHRSATPLRWQTLNSPDRRLAFVPPEGSENKNMSAIDIDNVAEEIVAKYSHFFTDKNS